MVTSILGFCLETLPSLKPIINVAVDNSSNSTNPCEDSPNNRMAQVMSTNRGLNILDIICTIFFTIELIIRFIFAPKKLSFVTSMMNIIDLLALVPLYTQQLVFNNLDLSFCYANERMIIEIMFLLRIIRMFRIFHLVRHYQALKILIYALKASVQELFMLAIFLFIGMLVFASLIYYAERQDAVHASDMFYTIPIGFWWAIITMCMVGYGDVHPINPLGYVVGSVCAVSGVLLLSLTIPVISNNFTLFYTHVRSGADRPAKFQSRGSKSLLASQSDEGIHSSIADDDDDRKPLSGSAIHYMNGSANYGSLATIDAANNNPNDKSFAVACFSDKLKRKFSAEFQMRRRNSEKARSDDGIVYEEEAML